MGHRKARGRSSLARVSKNKPSGDRLLIVTEDSKSVPTYFGDIRRIYRKSTARVRVLESKRGTAPIDIVDYAQELFKKGEPRMGIESRAFEKVYAVFDRDQHASFDQAVQKARSLNCHLKNDEKRFVAFKAIVSVPSFELWLLLHFEDIHALLSQGDLLKKLRRHLPDYEKSAKGLFCQTKDHLDDAKKRAQCLRERGGCDFKSPLTEIDEVIVALQARETLNLAHPCDPA